MKTKFKIENHRVCMHCNTLEKAETFLRYLNSKFKNWRENLPYVNLDGSVISFWDIFKENTVYYFFEGTYGEYVTAAWNGAIIYEFDDFEWSEYEKL